MLTLPHDLLPLPPGCTNRRSGPEAWLLFPDSIGATGDFRSSAKSVSFDSLGNTARRQLIIFEFLIQPEIGVRLGSPTAGKLFAVSPKLRFGPHRCSPKSSNVGQSLALPINGRSRVLASAGLNGFLSDSPRNSTERDTPGYSKVDPDRSSEAGIAEGLGR